MTVWEMLGPEQAAVDVLCRIIRHVLHAWNRQRIESSPAWQTHQKAHAERWAAQDHDDRRDDTRATRANVESARLDYECEQLEEREDRRRSAFAYNPIEKDPYL